MPIQTARDCFASLAMTGDSKGYPRNGLLGSKRKEPVEGFLMAETEGAVGKVAISGPNETLKAPGGDVS